MNHVLFAGWLIGCAIGFASPGFGAAAAPRTASILQDVKELDKLITYTETKIPLGELVQKVAADTGTTLTAAPEVADEPIMLCVRDFPARELLEQLADLLDYRWTQRTGEGARERPTTTDLRRRPGPQHLNTPIPQHPAPVFVIYQDLASRQDEEALREKLFAVVEKSLRDQLRTYAELAALAPEQLERLAAEAMRFEESMRKLSPDQSEAYFRVPQNRQRSLRLAAARALQSPIQGTLARLIITLPEARWATLRAGDELRFSTDPKPGELRLPEEMERRLRSAQPTLLAPGSRLAYPTPEEEEKLRRQEQTLQEAWKAATGFRISVRLDLDRVRTQAAASLGASVMPFRSGGPLDVPFLYGGTALRLSASARPDTTSREENSPERRAALEKDPVLGAKQAFRRSRSHTPTTTGRPLPPGGGSRRSSPSLPGPTTSTSFPTPTGRGCPASTSIDSPPGRSPCSSSCSLRPVTTTGGTGGDG